MTLEEVAKLTTIQIQDDTSLFVELKEKYMSLFGRSLCCLPEVESALLAINNYLNKQNSEPMADQLFQLKTESLLYSVASDTYYTEKTLTDDDAILLLSASPQLISQFEVFPENWKELCSVTDENATPKAVEGYDANTLSVNKTKKK